MKTKAIKDMTDDELLGDSLYYVEIIASQATPPMSARLEHSISAFAEYTARKLRLMQTA